MNVTIVIIYYFYIKADEDRTIELAFLVSNDGRIVLNCWTYIEIELF